MSNPNELMSELSQAKKRIEELEAKVPRWIPVSERMPESCVHVALVDLNRFEVEETFIKFCASHHVEWVIPALSQKEGGGCG